MITTLQEFKTPADFQAYVREKCTAPDAMIVDGIIYTQDNYDMAGREITYGNKSTGLALTITTHDRYGESRFEDAKIEVYEDGSYRNDINYLD